MKLYLTLSLSLVIHTHSEAAEAPRYQVIGEQQLVKINQASTEKLKNAVRKHDVQEVEQLLEVVRPSWLEFWKGNIGEIPDVDAKESGVPLLIYAIATKAPPRIVQLLINAGANIQESHSQDIESALMTAVAFDNRDAVQMLIKSGANLDAQNPWGKTALIYAAEKGHAQVFQQLLYAGADMHIKHSGNKNKTVVDYAHEGGRHTPEHVIQGRLEIQKILEQYKKEVAQKVEANLPPVLSQVVSEYVCE